MNSLYLSIKKRNEQMYVYFEDIYNCYEEQLKIIEKSNREMKVKDEVIKKELQSLELLEKRLIVFEEETNKQNVSPLSLEKINELNAKVLKLQTEVSNAYKMRSDVGDELARVSKQLHEKTILCDSLMEENSILNNFKEEMNVKHAELEAEKIIIVNTNKNLVASLLEKDASIMELNKDNEILFAQIRTEQENTMAKLNMFQQLYDNCKKSYTQEQLTAGIMRLSSEERELLDTFLNPSAEKIDFTKEFEVCLHNGELHSLKTSNTQQVGLSGGSDGNVCFFSTSNGQLLRQINCGNDDILSTAFSNDGSMAVCGTSSGSLKVFNANQKQVVGSLTGHTKRIYCCDFYSNRNVVSASHDRTLKLWDVTKMRAISNLFIASSTNCLAISGDGLLCISGHQDGNLRSIDLRTNQIVREPKANESLHGYHVADVCFYDSDRVVSVGSDSIINVLDLRNFQVVKRICIPNFSLLDYANGTVFKRHFYAIGDSTGKTHVVDLKKGEEVACYNCSDSPISAVGYCSNSRTLLAGDRAGCVKVFR
eukprot:TRINITY_DN1757_c0_g1_i1.p1 TRINITY_DN1757_c0_g1~~TRINITY_DN1757_c0_g1_i1.p1  ORF type:complete len:538 (+),score=117.93 TRINITY_DN1757_c0_g1_i1:65-1678(+)